MGYSWFGLPAPEPPHAALAEHDASGMAVVTSALGEHDPTDVAAHERAMLAKEVVANRQELERQSYYRKHGIREGLSLGNFIWELVAISLECTIELLTRRALHLFILMVKVALIVAVLEVLIHKVGYETLHYGVDPVLTGFIDMINAAYGFVADGVNVVTNTIIGAVNKVPLVNIHVAQYEFKHKVAIRKSSLGSLYYDIVDMKSRCEGVYTGTLPLIQNGLRVVTSSTLCQFFRMLYPSPALAWMPVLLYGSAFADPAEDNCVVHTRDYVCTAWSMPDFIEAVFWCIVYWTIVDAYIPLIKFQIRFVRSLGFALWFKVRHPRHRLSFQDALDHHVERGCVFTSKYTHYARVIKGDHKSQVNITT